VQIPVLVGALDRPKNENSPKILQKTFLFFFQKFTGLTIAQITGQKVR